jgi:tRNA G37 N-methylase Trm5
MKQRIIDNPNIAIEHSIKMKQLYYNNPSKKEDMSKLKTDQYRDNPEMIRQQSELKLMYYEDKYAFELIENIRKKSIEQWKDQEKKKKIMDEKRNRFSKPFNVYKDGILIDSFDYVPDCALKMFGKNDSNISAVLKGRKKVIKVMCLNTNYKNTKYFYL